MKWPLAALCGLLAVAQIATRAAVDDAETARLTDVTARAGITFTHHNGAFGKKFLPETMGSGVAFVDVDNDGDQDLIFADGTDWPTLASGQNVPTDSADRGASASRTRKNLHTPRLYLNNGDGTFVDATMRGGLSVEMYGMGIAAADYDNDGWPDLLFTAVGQNRLFHNTGRGSFVDVTDRAGLGGRAAFSTSAMWFDYDRDGRLDLFICNYVKWTPETDIYCSVNGRDKTYCTPEAYRGSTAWLFRNRGDGTFEDATAAAGVFDVTSKSLGVTMLDYDQDGWPDVFVANDTQPNKLYRNNHNGTFTELGLQSGLAFSEDGRARAGMGVDAADFDNTGRPAVIVTNFSGEMLGLYAPSAGGRYVDVAPRTDVGRATRHTLGWGCFFFDFDLDGLQDLLIVNGHLDEVIARGQGAGAVKYAERPHLFLNRGADRGFHDIADTLGADFAIPKVGRGAAFADIDADGDLDLVITTNGGPAFLYRNDLIPPLARDSASRSKSSPTASARPSGSAGATVSDRPDAPRQASSTNMLRLKLRGVTSNRDAIGALVRVTVGGQRLSRFVKTGSSYLSQSELPLTFGLGTKSAADDVSIDWPGGQHERLGPLQAGAEYEIQEGRGITRTRTFGTPPR